MTNIYLIGRHIVTFDSKNRFTIPSEIIRDSMEMGNLRYFTEEKIGETIKLYPSIVFERLAEKYMEMPEESPDRILFFGKKYKDVLDPQNRITLRLIKHSDLVERLGSDKGRNFNFIVNGNGDHLFIDLKEVNLKENGLEEREDE